MYQEVYFSDFCDRFRDMNRDENFSYEGKKALFEYLEDYEDQTDEKMELDIIAICCEYTEYENLKEFQDNYDEEKYQTIEDIENSTTIIKIDNSDGFIIACF